MSHEALMKRRYILVFAILALSGCTSQGFSPYDCMQLEEEPYWNQVALDTESEAHYKELVEIHYSNAPKETFLMNKDKRRKYFWYRAESGEILACVVDKNMWRKYHEGCFSDRIIISTDGNGAKLKEADSVVCT